MSPIVTWLILFVVTCSIALFCFYALVIIVCVESRMEDDVDDNYKPADVDNEEEEETLDYNPNN